jgi:acetyl esterase/lipase
VAAAADAGVPVEITDVPGAHHSFDTLDDTDESRSTATPTDPAKHA